MAKPFPQFGPFNIIADTNALYSQNPKELISAGFETSLVELRKLTAIQLFIPHVVIGELAYQKFEIASAAIHATNSKLNILAEITTYHRPPVCSVGQAKKLITKRYKDWVKTTNARLFMPKVKQTTWNKIVEEAVWRVAPFESSENKKHEKGFRDRIVLESFIQICAKTGGEIVLLTGDILLGEAANNCGIKNLTVVPRLEDFTSRVRLLKEKETNEWVSVLFAEAIREFYASDKPDCLYLREKVGNQLLMRAEDLNPVPVGDALTLIFEPKKWDRQTEEQITIGTTQYENRSSGRLHWKTQVMSAAAFSGKGIFDVVKEIIRVSTFAVLWSSDDNGHAEIKNSKIENISLADRQMVPDTSETRTKWSLPTKPIPPFQFGEIFKSLPSTSGVK